MATLLTMIVFFSFLGCIGIIPLFIYSKRKKDFKYKPEKLSKILKVLVATFVISFVLFGITVPHKNNTKAVQAQAQQEQSEAVSNVTDKSIDSGKYTGTLKGENRDGKGIFVAANGDTYDGEWKDNKMNGQGKLTYANGDVYSGNYENGLRSGQGTFTWKDNNDKYTGEWDSDLMSGHGAYTFGSGKNSGDKYDGEWSNNKMNGQGTYTYSNGQTITGTWKDNNHVEESK